MSVTYEEQRTEQEKRIDADVLARVKRGLAWLEETHGPGWEDKIDLATLDLRDGNVCVLGQVYGAEAAACQDSDGINGFGYGLLIECSRVRTEALPRRSTRTALRMPLGILSRRLGSSCCAHASRGNRHECRS